MSSLRRNEDLPIPAGTHAFASAEPPLAFAPGVDERLVWRRLLSGGAGGRCEEPEGSVGEWDPRDEWEETECRWKDHARWFEEEAREEGPGDELPVCGSSERSKDLGNAATKIHNVSRFLQIPQRKLSARRLVTAKQMQFDQRPPTIVTVEQTKLLSAIEEFLKKKQITAAQAEIWRKLTWENAATAQEQIQSFDAWIKPA